MMLTLALKRQVTSEHDALKQKCNNITMMLNS